MTIDYQTITLWGILCGMLVALGKFVKDGVLTIYCKGKQDNNTHERIKLLEDWKLEHITEYKKLLDREDEIKEGLSDVGKKIEYLRGLFESKD